MGYKRAGFRVIGAVDIDPQMMGTYLLNFPETPSFLGGVGEIAKMEASGLIEQWRGCDILDGSPPCTTFSMAGTREKNWGVKRHFREGDTEQILDQLFFDYLRLVEAVQPKVFVAENVAGMLAGNARGYVRKVVEVGRDYGYDVQVFRLSASQYGVPQLRPRVFFIGRRRDLSMPALTLPPARTTTIVSDALAGTGCTCGGEGCALTTDEIRAQWQRTPIGRTAAAYYEHVRGRQAGYGRVKVNPAAPSLTVVSANTYFHWTEKRQLCLSELFRLATFPDDYQMLSAINSRNLNYKAIYLTGMSVPPFLMEAVARQVRADVLQA